jgi:uncharacterized protein YfaS (alpha-2-macroglobulin family)
VKHIEKLILLLAAAAPGLSQSESEPYFALSTARTFGSKGRPSVSLSAWNVDSLEFRVYRVDDPMKFFEQIENPHEFGGRAPRPPHERTLLERIHMWKHDVRTDLRRSMRAQFTESPSEHLGARPSAAAAAKPAAGGAKGTHYAEAPLLNSQQLVLTFQQPVLSHSRWEQETVEVGVKDRGVYLVEAVRGELRAYTILIVSDIALVSKTRRDGVVNLLVNRSTGEPIPHATVALLTRDQRIAEAETNSDGIADLALKGSRADDLRIVARQGGDYAVNTPPGYSFGVNSEQWMGYLYTDRPVYRPGHTVHFKGVLRLRNADGFSIPAGKVASVTINDSDQKPVYQKNLTISAAGSIRDDLTLGAGAGLGNYFIEIKAGDGVMSGNFEVQEYKKPEYEVRVIPTKSRVIEGESVQATIDARYYFGEPVAGAKVTYAIYRDRYWFPMWYDPDDDSGGFQNTDNGNDADDSGGDQVAETEGKLDADGKLTISVPTTVSDHRFDFNYRIEARVTDQGNREISGRGWVLATYGSIVLNVTPERYFYPAGSRARFTVQARDYESKPVQTHAHVELQLWNPRQTDKWDTKATAEVDVGADGSGVATINLPPQGGEYRLRATARTPEGRDVQDDGYVWVSGAGWNDFGRSQNRTVQIVPDQKSYRAGETAKLLVVTGQPNTPVWVTVEGRDLRQQKLVRSQDATATFEVPLSANDEPGITLSAAYVRKGNLYSGQKYLKVPPLDHQLNVKVTTDKPQYLPGQTADYSIEATTADGQPAARAEFSLGVVDEAIYGIRKDSTQDILSFFFERDWNRVSTDTSFNYFFHGEAGKRRMRLAELRPASRLAQLKPERLVQPKIRKAFPDTAFWGPELVTDGNGRAHAKVEFPDSLTTWRATARGATPDTKVGAAVIKTIVRKNLILRLVVPRFFVQGDEVTISALVHNYLADTKTAHISLDVAGLDVLDGGPREVQIASRGEVKVDWRVRAQQVSSATVTGKALTNEESDAMELVLPVNIPGVKMAEAKGGSMAAGGAAAFDLTFPAKVQPGSRRLAIRLSPSIAGSLFGALEYLTSFPYGCVEQTMSSFLPDITVAQVVRELGLKSDLDQASLQEKIRAGLDRLYNFQHEDGGWGWWETDESHPFMTAYVVAGLMQAQAAGTQIKPEAITNGVAWVKKDFAQDPKLAGDLRAYMMYSLAVAGQPDTAGLNSVYDKRSNLSPYGLALLGLALQLVKDGRASEIASTLERGVQQDPEQAWWSATRDQMLDFSEDVSPEATAYAVKFLAKQNAGNPLLPKAAVWLMNHRNEGYWWTSTKQTAMVIYGLTDYLKATNELNPNLTATVLVNDQPVLTRKLTQAGGIEAPEFVLDESKLAPDANHIRVTSSGSGRLYYSARAEYYSTDDKLQRSGSTSLNVLRDYFRLVPGRDGDRIVYDTAPLNGPAATGDIIAVRLTVTGTEWKYMLLEDPIPAGTEFIERDNLYELRSRPPWWAYMFTRRELHDNRMALFQTWFPKGQQTFFYLLKVVNPGIFQVSPARVGPMYQPGVMATSDSRRLEVK